MAKQPTEKQIAARKKFGEQAKARAAARKLQEYNERQELLHGPDPAVAVDSRPVEAVDPGNIQSDSDVEQLRRMVMELQATILRGTNNVQATGPQAGTQGLIGTYEKYKLDPAYYPNPIDALKKEPRLQRFAFGMNYELDWNVSVSSYKTLDGVNTKEPKFTLELNRIMLDEDTGDQTDGRYTICRAVFHEDPEAAIVVAREQGLEVGDSNEKEFLDAMRYLRMRDWLLEAFYPPKANQEKKNKKDMVINGKLVQYFEINSEDAESVPFGQLDKKKML